MSVADVTLDERQLRDRLLKLEGAYKDAIAALRYIRWSYGDLYGVGWGRLDAAYEELLPESERDVCE